MHAMLRKTNLIDYFKFNVCIFPESPVPYRDLAAYVGLHATSYLMTSSVGSAAYFNFVYFYNFPCFFARTDLADRPECQRTRGPGNIPAKQQRASNGPHLHQPGHDRSWKLCYPVQQEQVS